MCKHETVASAVRAQGSRRRRLWEVDHKHHCLVIGVCFDVRELRQLVGRLVKVPGAISDFELHRCTVQACEARGQISELLHKTLEKRYRLGIGQFRALHTQPELAIRWRTAVTSGDIANTLWAILTHPCCDETLADAIYGELHMLQHQVGSAQRREVLTLHTLQRENAALIRELATVQTRATQDRDQRIGEITQLRQMLEAMQGERVGLQAQLATQQRELREIHNRLPDLQDRERLVRRIHTAEAQCVALRAQAREQQLQAEHWQRECLRLSSLPARPQHAGETAPNCQHADNCTLTGKQVLCIGGRPGIIEFYRQLVEDQGGRFSHHDGGMEENLALLEPSIAAADAVICQTGCINHNAYWRVKDFCKRTGKPCVFVKTPGISSFQRGLAQLAEPATS